MKKLQLFVANLALWLACLPGAILYLGSLLFPRFAQDLVLSKILSKTGIESDEFKELPVTYYEDYREQLEELRVSGTGSLTSEPVLYLAPTSGSLGARKLIPYTASLKQAFRRGIDPWIFLLYVRYPKLFLRRQFWLVTLSDKQYDDKENAVRVGYDEDEEYLGSFQRWLLGKVWVRIPQNSDESLEDYLVRAAGELTQVHDLGLVSVWSPSLVLGPLGVLKTRRPIGWKGVMSCWADGFAQEETAKLQELMPQSSVQPKGLISTEAFCTVPLGSKLHLLSYASHYFEFRETEASPPLVASELENGKSYELIVTTQSGLLRYATGDRVRIETVFCGHPSIRFVGRSKTSDLRGEKLHEEFVGEVVSRCFDKLGVAASFWFVAPRLSDTTPQYVMYLSADEEVDLSAIAVEVEEQFCESYHYNLCQQYGQLLPLAVTKVADNNPEMLFIQQTAKLTGAKPGSVKVSRLSTLSGWDEFFSSQAQ